MWSRFRLHIAFRIAMAIVVMVPLYAQQGRPMVVDDLFGIQTLGEVRLSPDRSPLAIVMQRAKRSQPL